MEPNTYDFSGYATRFDLTCGDGRIIRQGAFAHNDGKTVSLVWNHQHNDPSMVLGHAVLENRDDGVYAYCTLNGSDKANAALNALHSGDISGLSIWANQLQQNGPNVVHGDIKELSMVLAGANPGAYVDYVVAHSDDGEVLDGLYANYDQPVMMHAAHDDSLKAELKDKPEATDEKGSGKTFGEVLKTFNEEQRTVLKAMVGMALAEAEAEQESETKETDKKKGDESMIKHNVFEGEQEEATLSHDAMNAIFADAKRCGTLSEAVMAHSADYGIEQIDYLFPEARTMNPTPEFIKRETGWVPIVMNAVHRTPFSRIKSVFANITEDDARARGYMKGKLKKEEVFSLLKRTTAPTTIYKKQKLDRDDVVDITDFNVVAWIKSEMRIMLNEEIARAVLIGDGRLTSSDDHIDTSCVRPIYSDSSLYTIQKKVSVAASATASDKAKAFIKAVIKSRKDYKGSGEPTLFTTEDFLTDMLLIEDSMGHLLYESEAKLAQTLRVKNIVTVPVMENQNGVDGGALMGIVVNLKDYNIGADKGGAINMFEDFDIDYNQMAYLIETRISGALVKPYSAIALELDQAAS